MKKFLIIREKQKNQTPGVLFVLFDNVSVFQCSTLELPWLGNKRNVSCIPPGNYQVNKIDSRIFGKHFDIIGVPARSGIKIHSGNFASGMKVDTRGCVLPGLLFSDLNADGSSDICYSRSVLTFLWDIMPDDFIMTIE